MTKPVTRGLRHLPLTIAVVAALQAMPAFAQEQSTTDSAAQSSAQSNNAKDLDRIVVTGSLLSRPEYETASPVQVISIEKGIAAGQFDTADFLQASAVAASSTQVNNQFGGFIVEGGTGVQTVSLRGLGANRTLVLLDGQRPGPAGTRGQVGAFDLNVVPTAIMQRLEIVKDGSSSIYGSDAVAGVVNLITRKSFERPQMTYQMSIPQEGGGEQFSASIANGWNVGNGNIVAAAQWDRLNALTYGDRDYLRCAQDMVWGTDGQRIDREDRSILAGTPLGGCSTGNLYANTVMDLVTGARYIPSPDGSTVGLIPGYRPRPTPSPTYANSPQAYYEDVLNFKFWDTAQVINQRERVSLYGATDFGFDSFNWKTQWLYNRRETKTHSYRQFFPLIGSDSPTALAYGYNYPDSPGYTIPVPSGIAQPVMPFPSDQKITVDYFYGATKLDGLFKSTDSWSWEVNATYTRSDGDYENLAIDASKTGDLDYSTTAPTFNYFDPSVLSGERMSDLVNAVGTWIKGNTVYDQATVNAIVTGNLFALPAGDVAAAFGAEYRYYSIDDQPDELSRNGMLWGSSSAQVTKGNDRVREAFAEVDVPLLKGIPAIESLSVNLSGRLFKYNSVADSDNVWKAGLNWQVTPWARIRGTVGTSYRAPGLYELYLGNQTGFLSQTAIDPCILWGESNNDFLRANCGAAGIPDTYTGAASSATIYSGGGKGVLVPETSKARTLGMVLTPTGSKLSVAVDYFDYEIRDEIGQLTTGDIISGCYGSATYPNSFCDLIERNAPDHATAPNMIVSVQNKYININRQRTRGYDLQVNYDNDFSFGSLSVDGQVTYTIEDTLELFSTAEASGFTKSNQVGYIGRPKTVGIANVSLERGDWSFAWQGQYVSSTENLDLSRTFTYQGYAGATRDIKAGWQLRHNVSASYNQGDWAITLGVRNLFDKAPDLISTGAGTRYGNVPLYASQYDWYGRTFFARLQYKF